MAPNSVIKKYTLGVGENTFASPSATNSNDARKLQSLIPSLSGALEREHPAILFTNDAPFASRVGFFHTYKRNTSGVITYYFFCATATTLYQLQSPGPSQTWVAVSSVGTLAGFPVARNIANQMHISDGVSSWIFGGSDWVKDGLDIPLHAPGITVNIAPTPISISSISRVNGVVTVAWSGGVNLGARNTIAGVADTSFNGNFLIDISNGPGSAVFNQPGLPDSSGSTGTISNASFSVLVQRYYWTTFTDTNSAHAHESSSSPISLGTGPMTNQNVLVQQRPGGVSIVLGSPTSVVGTGTDFSQNDVGQYIWLDGTRKITLIPLTYGASKYLITAVADAQHLTIATPIDRANTSNGYLILPQRATGWNIYASASETDKLGNLLATIAATNGFGALNANYLDQSPMIGTVGAYFSDVNRPLLNDPTLPTRVMDIFANRIFRRVENFTNFFSYSGYEEVLAEQAGSPYESVPGVDPNTVATQINETSYPDQSVVIRALVQHADSLFIGTEDNVIPLYGNSLSTFQLSNDKAFSVGMMGRKACCSTPFGLAFVSYDTKVYLYPSQYSFGVDSTTALVELGRPKRPEFELIDGADFDNVILKFYNWGRRNWLVLTYRRVDQTFGSWVFDFETKGWMQLQQGYTAVTVFEMTPGRKSLVAASTNNRIYVIDDLTGNFTPAPGTNYPVGYYREVIDFGDPNSNFAIKSIGFETSNSQMEVDMTLWLDPKDVDNPGTGITIPMTLTRLGANSLIGRPTSDTGGSCQRALVEFAVAASPVNGTFHGFTVEAEKLPASPTL